MRRVIAYVDGFNLYHAIDDLKKPHLKWVDLNALASTVCGADETLIGVHYFSAYATWLPQSVGRHKEYVKALQHSGVRCAIGHFKEKRRSCRSCHAQWIGHEEKESDVAMAVQIVADAFSDQFDRALVITADSDVAPAIRNVRTNFPRKSVDVIAPPGRFGHARDLKPKLEITQGRISRSLLPASATDPQGQVIFTRPPAYNPPPP